VRRGALHVVLVVATTVVLVFHLVVAVGSFSDYSSHVSSGETTILVAAEGHTMTTREALADAVVFGVAGAGWLGLWVLVVATSIERRRTGGEWTAWIAGVLVVIVSLVSIVPVGDVGGRIVVGLIAALPLVVVGAVLHVTRPRASE